MAIKPDETVIALRIADNGRGMTAEELSRAFHRFYRGSASVEGSGMGLSICEATAGDLGCKLALESPGRGRASTAAITLPIQP